MNTLWKRVYGHTQASGILTEDRDAETWALGPRGGAIQTAGWPEGRARQVLAWVEKVGLDAALAAAGDDVARWVGESASSDG